MAIVPRLGGISIFVFLGRSLPPVLPECFLGALIGPMSRSSSPKIGTGKVWAVLFDMGSTALFAVGS